MLTKQEMLDKLENIIDGVDPKTGEILPDDSILNRIDMLRLFYAIKDYMLDSKTKNNSKKNLAPFKLENVEGIVTMRVLLLQNLLLESMIKTSQHI